MQATYIFTYGVLITTFTLSLFHRAFFNSIMDKTLKCMCWCFIHYWTFTLFISCRVYFSILHNIYQLLQKPLLFYTTQLCLSKEQYTFICIVVRW